MSAWLSQLGSFGLVDFGVLLSKLEGRPLQLAFDSYDNRL